MLISHRYLQASKHAARSLDQMSDLQSRAEGLSFGGRGLIVTQAGLSFHHVVKDDSDLQGHLPQTPESCDYRCVPPCLVYVVTGRESSTLLTDPHL